MKFRKRQVIVEAERYWKGDESQNLGICHGCLDEISRGFDPDYNPEHGESPVHFEPVIHAPRADIPVRTGDWIVTGINGCKYPVDPDTFEKIYEPVASEAD